jgi:hypothetical protein
MAVRATKPEDWQSGPGSASASVSVPTFRLPLRELHDPESGLLDAERISNYLGISLRRLASALGRNYSTIHKTPSAPMLQPALRSIKRSLVILEQVLGDRAGSLAWLNSEHPMLDQHTPLDVVLAGDSDIVERMLERALEGIPS